MIDRASTAHAWNGSSRLNNGGFNSGRRQHSPLATSTSRTRLDAVRRQSALLKQWPTVLTQPGGRTPTMHGLAPVVPQRLPRAEYGIATSERGVDHAAMIADSHVVDIRSSELSRLRQLGLARSIGCPSRVPSTERSPCVRPPHETGPPREQPAVFFQAMGAASEPCVFGQTPARSRREALGPVAV